MLLSSPPRRHALPRPTCRLRHPPASIPGVPGRFLSINIRANRQDPPDKEPNQIHQTGRRQYDYGAWSTGTIAHSDPNSAKSPNSVWHIVANSARLCCIVFHGSLVPWALQYKEHQGERSQAAGRGSFSPGSLLAPPSSLAHGVSSRHSSSVSRLRDTARGAPLYPDMTHLYNQTSRSKGFISSREPRTWVNRVRSSSRVCFLVHNPSPNPLASIGPQT